MRRLLAAVIVLCLVPVMSLHAQTGVSDSRFARLAKGVNLSNWFWYGPDGEMGIRARFADSEFTALSQMGITFVRVPEDDYSQASMWAVDANGSNQRSFPDGPVGRTHTRLRPLP